MCLRMRMEVWYEDNLHGIVQAFRCTALPSHGLLCLMNLMRWDAARLLWVHKCINICLFYSRVWLPSAYNCWVWLFLQVSFWELLNWLSPESICDERLSENDWKKSWNCCCVESAWFWAPPKRPLIVEKKLSMKPPAASWNKDKEPSIPHLNCRIRKEDIQSLSIPSEPS